MTAIPILVILIILSALFSGLTLGMFSLDIAGLERKIKLGSKEAIRILDVRKDSNRLLCTLLLGNVAINAGITAMLAGLLTGAYAAGVATVLIFLFGEMLPQALVSKHAFLVASKTWWLVKGLMIVTYPVAVPLAWGLNKLFGKEITERFHKKELEALIQEQDASIDSDEKRIMVGAMKFSDKKAKDVITPTTTLFCLEAKTVLNQTLLGKIKDEHYSRIPVYKEDKNNIVGILFAKDLIGYDITTSSTVYDNCKKGKPLFIEENCKLDFLLNKLIEDKTHVSFVFNEFNLLMGIVTLEDIIEEIIKVEIMDESDTVADLQGLAKNSNRKVIIRE
jgi:metal transporter CNNM